MNKSLLGQWCVSRVGLRNWRDHTWQKNLMMKEPLLGANKASRLFCVLARVQPGSKKPPVVLNQKNLIEGTAYFGLKSKYTHTHTNTHTHISETMGCFERIALKHIHYHM